MSATAENSSPSLADQFLDQSEHDTTVTPMDAVLEAARGGKFTDDQCFRLRATLDPQAHDVLRLRRLGTGN